MNNQYSSPLIFMRGVHLLVWVILLFALSRENIHADELTFQSDFTDLKGWQNDSSRKSPQSYSLSDGILRMSTRPSTRDRVKIRTKRRFGAGRYSWRIFAPAMGKGDQASIGAFLYKDDKHEIDFEIGYGKTSVRKKLKAGPRDLICYNTSQGHPSSSDQILIKAKTWYVFSIDLTHGKDGNYLITWLVNEKQVKQLQSNFGDEVTFTAHCSVENLIFLGEHIPKQENYGLFDYFEFIPTVKNQPNKAAHTNPLPRSESKSE